MNMISWASPPMWVCHPSFWTWHMCIKACILNQNHIYIYIDIYTPCICATNHPTFQMKPNMSFFSCNLNPQDIGYLSQWLDVHPCSSSRKLHGESSLSQIFPLKYMNMANWVVHPSSPVLLTKNGPLRVVIYPRSSVKQPLWILPI